jgi:hypothetical protein
MKRTRCTDPLAAQSVPVAAPGALGYGCVSRSGQIRRVNEPAVPADGFLRAVPPRITVFAACALRAVARRVWQRCAACASTVQRVHDRRKPPPNGQWWAVLVRSSSPVSVVVRWAPPVPAECDLNHIGEPVKPGTGALIVLQGWPRLPGSVAALAVRVAGKHHDGGPPPAP